MSGDKWWKCVAERRERGSSYTHVLSQDIDIHAQLHSVTMATQEVTLWALQIKHHKKLVNYCSNAGMSSAE